MLTDLAWLALEVKYLPPARSFYEETLDLSIADERATEISYEVGPSTLILRRPSEIPRGGIHTHFACSIPAESYEAWWHRLDAAHDLEEFQFGDARSLYLYDPDGNCVELGQRDVSGPGICGIFEVALEVGSLDRAETFYEALGFETVDRGTDRRRIRMAGPMALELWEPQLGIADARGGVHVDLGFSCEDPDRVVDTVDSLACRTDRTDDGRVVVDPDGHHLTLIDR
ncbi:VOC family protein [Halovivax gelatinilyticus]|uniref:VOC family protein n=1 Tax=Halovivax gelatinilyticus TaxID=2961597 RepID=UPI0020CA8301|nr:VOC family protein [Halovivax gelatinilyticus]